MLDSDATPEGTTKPRLSRRLVWRVEYVALRGCEAFVGRVPRAAALLLGRAVGWLALKLGVRRAVVVANLRFVGMGSDAEIAHILPKLYANMGMYIMDLLRARRQEPPYRIHGGELLAQREQRGVIAILAHFGNFELLATAFGTVFSDVHVIVKPMHNPYVENWLDERRLATGVQIIGHKNAARPAFTTLKQNGVLAALIDQDPGAEGTTVPFLGKPASTVRAIAALQEHVDPQVVSAYARLGDDDVYDVVLVLERFDLDGLEKDARVTRIQERHNEIVGAWVRADPEYWFGWFHRRFRPFLEYPK
ncbi:MAG: hypothetical protein E2P02_04855 [Acidobacteria bacterium]|nr:MAG: hypothetical protein E2P02_04855 [Acidobacteriota bacterium]